MIRTLAALLVVCFVAGAQDIDSGALLSRVQEKVRENARAIPRLVCRQDIERRQFNLGAAAGCPALASRAPSSDSPVKSDRATLDVMLSGTEELFALPGGSRFEANNPATLLAGGLSGTGDFATYVISIFTSDATTFEYRGSCGREGCVRFSYDVPQFASTYKVATPLHEATLGYSGSFDVEPQSADLLSLTVIPTDLAETLPGACAMSTTVTYAKARAGAGEFIVPQTTDREYVAEYRDPRPATPPSRAWIGTEFRSRAIYGGCREFQSESAISFTGDPPAVKAAQPGPGPQVLPARGVELQLRLPEGIRSDAAAGDGLEGVLVKPVKDRQGGMLPAGPIFRGHITRLETVQSRNRIMITLGIRFDTIGSNSSAMPLTLNPAGKMDRSGAAVFSFDRGAVVGEGLISRWKVVQ